MRVPSQVAKDGHVAVEALGAALSRLPSGPVRGDALAVEMRGVTLQTPRGYDGLKGTWARP